MHFAQYFIISLLFSDRRQISPVTSRPLVEICSIVVKNTTKCEMTPHTRTETCYVRKCTYSNKMPEMSPCWAMFVSLFPPRVWFLWVLRLPRRKRGDGESGAEQNRWAISCHNATKKLACIIFFYINSRSCLRFSQRLCAIVFVWNGITKTLQCLWSHHVRANHRRRNNSQNFNNALL